MNNWQPIETYQKPTKELDIEFPKALFYSEKTGVVVGICYLTDEEDGTYSFQYERDGLNIEPTHWMPLPKPPPSGEEIVDTLCTQCDDNLIVACTRCEKVGCPMCSCMGFDSQGRYCCTECLIKANDLGTV
jgi:hypothetical protein